MRKGGIKPMIDERRFVPRSIDDVPVLYTGLLETGTSAPMARGLIGWLLTLPDTRSDDPAGNPTRTRYRQALLRLGTPPWDEAMGAYLSSGAAKAA